MRVIITILAALILSGCASQNDCQIHWELTLEEGYVEFDELWIECEAPMFEDSAVDNGVGLR